MTTHNVHIYREMRLRFDNIEAETPEAAAEAARAMTWREADDFDGCDGDNFAALVDVLEDKEFSRSVMINFEAERVRREAFGLLEALDYLLEQTIDQDLKYGIILTEGEIEAAEKAKAVIARARAA